MSIDFQNGVPPAFPSQPASATLGAPSSVIPATPAQATTVVGQTVNRCAIGGTASAPIDVVNAPLTKPNFTPPSQSGNYSCPIDDLKVNGKC